MGAMALITVAAMLDTTVSAANAKGTAGKAHGFSGNLCSLVSATGLNAVHVSASCTRARATTKVTPSPLGPVRIVHYYAHWGAVGGDHWLSLSVLQVHASAPALAVARNAYKNTVLANGFLFSANPLASDFLDTISCVNPPEDDCTLGKILELVKNDSVQLFVHDTAPFINADNTAQPAVDETNDRGQEETIKAAFEGIGTSVEKGL
jgi:hypothetical protein